MRTLPSRSDVLGFIGTSKFQQEVLTMPNGIHEHGYWLDNNDDGHHFDTRLAKALTTFFAGGSVLDVGCGRGNYVRTFRAAGIDCDGCDGNPLTTTFDDSLLTLDLSQPIMLPRVYDWVMSLEVGEHIPRDFEAAFIGNLHRHNRRGVVLSWAIPGQGGRGHVNEHTNDYVKDVLRLLGYFPCGDWETAFRLEARLPWFKNTLMVFKRLSI